MVKLAVLCATSSTRGDMKAFDCEFCSVMSAFKCICPGLEIPPRPSGQGLGNNLRKKKCFHFFFSIDAIKHYYILALHLQWPGQLS